MPISTEIPTLPAPASDPKADLFMSLLVSETINSLRRKGTIKPARKLSAAKSRTETKRMTATPQPA